MNFSRAKALLLLLLLLVPAWAGAAPLERDLGLGLAYCRVHDLPGDLPAASPLPAHPWVLDLRYVGGNDDDGAALLAWLKAHAKPRTPVFLLANAETSPALLEPLDSPDAVIGLVIIGPAAAHFTPDLTVPVAPEVERRAYRALEKGTPLTSLLVENLDKPRVDEEMLTREHLADSEVDDDDTPAAPSQPAKPPQLIDAVLQRAVQLHRTLLALKRL